MVYVHNTYTDIFTSTEKNLFGDKEDPEAYLRPCQTSIVEHCATMVNGFTFFGSFLAFNSFWQLKAL